MTEELVSGKLFDRYNFIKAMEIIIRNINNEEYIFDWLREGIADGDLNYNSFGFSADELLNLEFYNDDEEFKNLIVLFLNIISKAATDGGLYNSGVVGECE